MYLRLRLIALRPKEPQVLSPSPGALRTALLPRRTVRQQCMSQSQTPQFLQSVRVCGTLVVAREAGGGE